METDKVNKIRHSPLSRFGATYVGASKIISMQEAYPILFGDIDMSGNLQAHILHAPTDNLRYRGATTYQYMIVPVFHVQQILSSLFYLQNFFNKKIMLKVVEC